MVYCIACVQRIYEKAFLHWLCQYLWFLDIFFQYILPVGKEWGYPTLFISRLTNFKIMKPLSSFITKIPVSN